jgi:hypothetical protein
MLQVLDGPTIAQGESLSEGIDCSGGNIVRITVPQEYTRANMTFQVSSDGNGYNDLYDAQGNEVTIVAKPDSGIVIQEQWGRVVGFIKLRSGTRANPVEQQTDCKFAIAIEVADAPAGMAASAPARER